MAAIVARSKTGDDSAIWVDREKLAKCMEADCGDSVDSADLPTDCRRKWRHVKCLQSQCRSDAKDV